MPTSQEQSVSGTYIGSSAPTLAFPLANAAGNLIVAYIAAQGSSSITIDAPTDSVGNSYLSAAGPIRGAVCAGQLWYAQNIGGATNTITFHLGAASTGAQWAGEYSGIATASALEGSTGATGDSASPNAGTLTLPSASGLLVAGFCTTAVAVGITTGPSYVKASTAAGIFVEYRAVAASGAYAGNATMTAAKTWLAMMAAFSAVAAGGVPLVPRLRTLRGWGV